MIARSEAPLQEIRSQFPKQVRVLAGDVSTFSLAQEAVDLSLREFGRLDGLVLNHGVLSPVTNVIDCKVEDWKHHFDINFFSAVVFVGLSFVPVVVYTYVQQAKAALPALQKTSGCMIFLSSGAAVTGYGAWGAYGASKAALNHLALTISAEETSVTTISIKPGVVDTGMQRDVRENYSSVMREKDSEKFLNLHREGGLLKPEQPGQVIAKLVLKAPSELSGRFLRQVRLCQ